MSRHYLIVYILVVLFASPIHAGYREMRKEIETYEPPSVFQNGGDSSRDKIETAIDTNFTEELKKIRKLKTQWEKSLQATGEDFSFVNEVTGGAIAARLQLQLLHPAAGALHFDPDGALRIAAGMQNKIIQAMACETPVVATTAANEGVGGTPGEHLLVADDADGIRDAVVQLLGDPELAARIGRAAREFVEANWTWDALFERQERVLLEIAAK